jgi:1,4-dihydroxy-2-naphthoate octaprenyltransferase
MFDKTRRGATSFYLFMILVVMVTAIAKPELWPLVIFLMCIQFMAAIWYAASYIPYGRRILLDLFKKICLCGAVK